MDRKEMEGLFIILEDEMMKGYNEVMEMMEEEFCEDCREKIMRKLWNDREILF